jgi:hypothetical protein
VALGQDYGYVGFTLLQSTIVPFCWICWFTLILDDSCTGILGPKLYFDDCKFASRHIDTLLHPLFKHSLINLTRFPSIPKFSYVVQSQRQTWPPL